MVTTHTVVAGETLAKLAEHYYGHAELARFIAAANDIDESSGSGSGSGSGSESSTDRAGLATGRQLVIPGILRHTVRAEDTLADLAARYYGDAALASLIADENRLDGNDPAEGDVLAIVLDRSDGFGLTIVDSDEDDPRLWYYRFDTAAIGWDPGVNVLLPDDYHTSGLTYPVLYLFHGGAQDFRTFDSWGIRELTAGQPIVVVMPDGGRAGWYSNPTGSFVGPRNWETFHINQLMPWVEANFRVYAEPDGRAVAGYSMGGFGALKYTAKYPGRFASVSSHSGPASLRRDFGLVVHWANLTSATLELGGATVYGAPFWNQTRVSADNPVEHISSYSGKRIFLVAGTSPEPIDWFDAVNETQVLAGQREFRQRLTAAGIAHEAHEASGGHEFRPEYFVDDLEGIVTHLRAAELP